MCNARISASNCDASLIARGNTLLATAEKSVGNRIVRISFMLVPPYFGPKKKK